MAYQSATDQSEAAMAHLLDNLVEVNPANAEPSAPQSPIHGADNGVQLPVTLPAPPPPLPGLLRYIDNHLLENSRPHPHPPHPNALCCVCGYQHDRAPEPSAYLPLSPCGHWMHYRCFVWHVTRENEPRKDTCPFCGVKLFVWEGISALTIAARTGFVGLLEDEHLKGPQLWDRDVNSWVCGNKQRYEADCSVIEMITRRLWNVEVRRRGLPDHCSVVFTDTIAAYQPEPRPLLASSQYMDDPQDGSPNLMNMFNVVVAELDAMNRPTSSWLSWSIEAGFFLWCMFVHIKVRGFLGSEVQWVVGSEGWRRFDEGGRVLQSKILGDVRRE